MVGLPDSAVKESQQRVEAAIKHLGMRMPRQKVVVNLAPADIKKEGSSYTFHCCWNSSCLRADLD